MDGWLPLITGGAGAITGAIGAYLAIRKDGRETRSSAMTEASETIRLLKEQNGLLHAQLCSADIREKEWIEREKKMETRIGELESDYRKLVDTVTSMGYCALAPTCKLYNPGDRRQPTQPCPAG